MDIIRIPLNQLAIYFRGQITVYANTVFGRTEEIIFPQDSYWAVYEEQQSNIVVINLESKKLQKISFELFGKLLATQTDLIFLVNKSQIPKTIIIKS